jgi:hypothetical protein
MEVVPYVYQKATSSNQRQRRYYDTSDWHNEVPLSLNGKLGAVPPTFMDDLSGGFAQTVVH